MCSLVKDFDSKDIADLDLGTSALKWGTYGWFVFDAWIP